MLTIPAEIILAANAAKVFNEDMTAILDRATVAAESEDDAHIQEALDKFNETLDNHLSALASAIGGLDNLELIIQYLASK
jgi:hypothetical protein